MKGAFPRLLIQTILKDLSAFVGHRESDFVSFLHKRNEWHKEIL